MSRPTKPIQGTGELPIDENIKKFINWDIQTQTPVSDSIHQQVLTVDHLKMYFPVTKGILKRNIGFVKAVDDISFSIRKGETFGIVGESGSGKSTIGHCVMRNYDLTGGTIVFDGQDISQTNKSDLRKLRKKLQMITQDPYASLDPRMTVRQSILEGPFLQKLCKTQTERNDLVDRMLIMVGLNPKFAGRYPHEFSGGQRQRISIARALALSPAFIVCDEIVSALDVSIQAQIVSLMMKLQEELGLTYIFIGHDLSVVRHISNQVAVVYLGKIVEMSQSEELYLHPLHPYSQALISAAPIPNPTADRQRTRILLEGELPSPMHPPKGCRFCTRCIYADQRCREEEPQMTDVGGGHFVACHKVTQK